MDFLEVPHFVELKKIDGKNLFFSASPPQATPRDLLSRIARALRRGASGRLFGVPRHCAGRVARRRPGESQRQRGNSARWRWASKLEYLVDYGNPLTHFALIFRGKPWFFMVMVLGSKESIPQCPKRPFTCHVCRVSKNSKLRSTRHHSCEVWMERESVTAAVK